MKTIKYLIFFGGFMLFFNFSRAHAATVAESQPSAVSQLREQINHTFNHAFYNGLEQKSETITVDFVVGADSHLQVIEMSGGSPALKKLVMDKFATLQANSSLANERYSIQLTINLI